MTVKKIYFPVAVLFFASLIFSARAHVPAAWPTLQSDSLPTILAQNHGDFIDSKLRAEAKLKFATHNLPSSLQEWEKYRNMLREKIIEKTGIQINHDLPLDIRETRSIQMDGYTVKNIAFQTLPGIYATANLFVPDGKGPFPAAIVMMGHSSNGRLSDTYQSLSHLLALNGYVSLSMDPWGAGERTTNHGIFEYHGSNLGASLMNVGESLLGLQVTDNIRGVDLLSSLPYVDTHKIGATGTSGGGNQTMWLAAMDSRIKAAVPVTSVGTFESYVMAHNCICEVLVDGLTFTEESGILALVAPNALALYNGLKEGNPAFFPSEMMRSYENAKPIFKLYGVEDNLKTLVLDLPHGYTPPMREAMLGWFNLHLKGVGDGSPVKDLPFELVSEDDLMTFDRGKRAEDGIYSTEAYCKHRGKELRTAYLGNSTFDPQQKREELRELLRINEEAKIKNIKNFGSLYGWERTVLETSDGKLIPLLHKPPRNQSGEYLIIFNPMGKAEVPNSLIDELKHNGSGIVLADLSGTGEASSKIDNSHNLSNYHSIARAEIWLGRTVLGQWVTELDLISNFLTNTLNATKVGIDGSMEGGLAALFLAALEGPKIDHVISRDSPLSYLFDSNEGIDFYSMGIHIPGFLEWGDLSLAAALSGKNITFINPRTMSGKNINGKALQNYITEYENIRGKNQQSGNSVFIKD